MFDVICINDSHKPNDIPSSQWVVKDRKYFVIEVAKMRVQGGLLGFKLAEVNLDGCFPYEFYAASRFAILVSEEKFAELKQQVKEKTGEELVLNP